MRLKLHIWRQENTETRGGFETYELAEASPDMSFLEMLDVLNEQLIEKGQEPVAFEHDCREGICGSCGLMINGQAHGPERGTATCQLHMRKFSDGDSIRIEPWRSAAFPVIKDLVVDRSPLDKVIQAGGYISINAGSPQDANALLIPKPDADLAMDAAECIGCGACVAQCPNGAGQLFTAAKVSHLALLPQGRPERRQRALKMVREMESYFGSCSNFGECEAACPKEISIEFIGRMNHEYLRARLLGSSED